MARNCGKSSGKVRRANPLSCVFFYSWRNICFNRTMVYYGCVGPGSLLLLARARFELKSRAGPSNRTQISRRNICSCLCDSLALLIRTSPERAPARQTGSDNWQLSRHSGSMPQFLSSHFSQNFSVQNSISFFRSVSLSEINFDFGTH